MLYKKIGNYKKGEFVAMPPDYESVDSLAQKKAVHELFCATAFWYPGYLFLNYSAFADSA